MLQAQPYYLEDINAGSDSEPELPPPFDPHAGLDDSMEGMEGPSVDQPGIRNLCSSQVGDGIPGPWVPALPSFERGRARQRAALARRYGEARFMALVQRVRCI